ncbi:MAG: Abi family protein [Alphaproteobacteria bacterium]|nr:Abi family protein [Alphaproteobacteria bacterium]
MPIPYSKPHLNFEQQIALLKSRHMMVTDEAKAKECLQRIGYYRLSGYWYPFRQTEARQAGDGKLSYVVVDQFRYGSDFKNAVDLYVFDKKLRLLFLDALERIEVALRVDVASHLGRFDPFAYSNVDLLHGNFTKKVSSVTGQTGYTEWLSLFNNRIVKSKEEFILHYRETYDPPLPIWIAVELWDFGMLSKFLSGMRHDDLAVIAARYGIPRPELLTSWMRSMNLVRNICAHHARLWNRSLTDRPKLPKNNEIPLLNPLVDDQFANYRLYGVAAVMCYFLRTINPTTSWIDRLKDHLATFPVASGVSIQQTGFPAGWENLPLWN